MLRSKMSSWSRVACNRYSRESGRSGASRKARSRAYSPLLRAIGRSCGSMRRRLRRSSRHPPNLYPPPLDVASGQGPSILTASQHGAESGIQFADTERLGEVVVGTKFESDHTVDFIVGTTCQNNDRDVRTGTNFPEQIEPIVLAEVQVENDRACVPAS